MNRMPSLIFGAFCTFALAWAGLIFTPYFQLGNLDPYANEDTGKTLPAPLTAQANRGIEVYGANGCVYCHSQQIRGKGQGGDTERFGGRRTVARDYMYERRVFLGTMRTGPDLSNIGAKFRGDSNWHYVNLYDSRIQLPHSIMPTYQFLFEKHVREGAPRTDAVKFPEGKDPAPGYDIVPTQDAKDLVAYLLGLDKTYPLPEAEEFEGDADKKNEEAKP